MKKLFKGLLMFVLSLCIFTAVSCDGEYEDEELGGGNEQTGGSVEGGNDVEDEVTPEGVRSVKIMFHVDKNSAEGKAYQKRIDAFNAAYKDKFKASASFVARTTGASMYETDLMNKQQEGTLPDIITFDAPNCASYAKSKLLYQLDDLIPATEINDFISVSRFDGKIYGLPIQESSAGFFYNKQIFDKAGIDVSSYTVDNPWTFEQFKDVCAKLKKFGSENSGYSKYAVDMRLVATKDETATYMLYSFIYAAGGEFVSEDGYTAKGYLNGAGAVKGFEFLKSLISDGYTGYDVGATDFVTGKIGMYLSSGWTIPELDNKFREYFPDRDSWGILPYPMDVNKASATGSWCFGITNNHNKDKTAAKELLMWLTSVESAKAITDATGMIPARKSVETNYAPNSPEDVLYQQLLKTGRARPDTVGYPKLTTAFTQIISELKAGNVEDILNSKAFNLQRELDNLKNR